MNDNKVVPFPVVSRPIVTEVNEENEEETKTSLRIEEVIERLQERKFKNLLVIGIQEDGESFYDAGEWEMKTLMFLVQRLQYRLNVRMDELETKE